MLCHPHEYFITTRSTGQGVGGCMIRIHCCVSHWAKIVLQYRSWTTLMDIRRKESGKEWESSNLQNIPFHFLLVPVPHSPIYGESTVMINSFAGLSCKGLTTPVPGKPTSTNKRNRQTAANWLQKPLEVVKVFWWWAIIGKERLHSADPPVSTQYQVQRYVWDDDDVDKHLNW